LAAPMVGRTRQLGQLVQAFDTVVAAPAWRLVTVLGAAGVGKSRLVEEFLALAQRRASVLQGRCLEQGQATTYWPVAEVVRQAAGITESSSLDEVRARLVVLLGGDREAGLVAERIAAILGLAEAGAVAGELPWALGRLLETLARQQPVVVVLDDLQWAAPALLDLVEQVTNRASTAPVLLVGVARTELLDVRPQWPAASPGATSLLLEPLSRRDAGRLIDGLLGDGEGGAAVRAWVTDAAGGNPLFVQELVAMLIDDGVLVRRDGTWTASGDVAALEVPPTIMAVLAARLERLDPAERAVLQRASVVGEVFSPTAVAELVPAPARRHVASYLHRLSRKGLVRADRSMSGAGGAFRFRHLLVREAAYHAVPKQQRAELHEQYADWLAEATGERLAEYEEVVGYHLEQAYRYHRELGPPSDGGRALARRAAGHLAQAYRRAQDRGDVAAAAGLAGRAAALLPERDPHRLVLLPELGTALFWTGELGKAETVLGEAITLARAAGDRRVEHRARLEQLFIRLGNDASGVRPDQVRHEAEQTAAVLGALGDDHGLARAWYLIGQAHGQAGRFAAATRAQQLAIGHAERAGEPWLGAWLRYQLGFALVLGPLPRAEATAAVADLLAWARAGGYRSLEGGMLLSLGVLEAMAGRIDQARALFADGRDLLAGLGPLLEQAAIAIVSALTELTAGDPARAEPDLRAAYERLLGMGERGYCSTCAADLAETLYRLGRYEEASHFADQSRALAGPNDVTSQHAWRGVQAKLLARAGRHAAAEHLARAGAELAATTDDLWSQGRALLDLATVLQAAGRLREAAAAARLAARRFERKGIVPMAEQARRTATKLQPAHK
jgi:tetratricopeptide (TPR) repeat protein